MVLYLARLRQRYVINIDLIKTEPRTDKVGFFCCEQLTDDEMDWLALVDSMQVSPTY